jgi:Asp-tRNA(Asn)/Glu-tRNA(Gln) amidotransferase A subunit family amidase
MSGAAMGLLEGLPIAIKDLEMTRGVRTTGGSLVFKDRVPDMDSALAERTLRSGRAVLLGKTNTPEFGMLGSTENRLGPPCVNPWDTSRTAGGSSGGSAAAVAAGLCPLASGSDAAGSIRIPASFCGAYGIKPSLGRVPRTLPPVGQLAPNPFAQPGPIARSVKDAAIFLQAIAGPDPRDPVCLLDEPGDYIKAVDRKAIAGLRLAWCADFGSTPADMAVVRASASAARAFESLGCGVEEVSLPLPGPLLEALTTISNANSYAAAGHLLNTQAELLTDYVRGPLGEGSRVTGVGYARALGDQLRLKAAMGEFFRRYDLLLTPTTAVTAFPVGTPPSQIAGRDVDAAWGFNPYTYLANLLGNPAATLPCGMLDGLPVGLQVIGRFGEEATVLAASAAFEEARPWARQRPPVS